MLRWCISIRRASSSTCATTTPTRACRVPFTLSLSLSLSLCFSPHFHLFRLDVPFLKEYLIASVYMYLLQHMPQREKDLIRLLPVTTIPNFYDELAVRLFVRVCGCL
jgi:hypothetical protein